jgi:hypothetical protein
MQRTKTVSIMYSGLFCFAPGRRIGGWMMQRYGNNSGLLSGETLGNPESRSTPSDAGRRDAYGCEPETGTDTYDVPAVSVYIFVGNPGPCLTTDQQYTVLLLQINPNTPTAMAILLRRSTASATPRRHGLFLPMEFLRPCCFLAFLVVHVRLHMARPRQCPRAIPCLTNSSSLGAVSRFHVGAASMLACQIIYVVANGQQVWRAKRRTGTN